MPAAPSVSVQMEVSTRRVRDIDFHPSEPLLLCALYTGQAGLWNYESGKLVSMVNVGTGKKPARCARFIPRIDSFVCGCDDGWLYVHTVRDDAKRTDKIMSLHGDFLRGISVHATLPFVLTCGDDFTVRCFDYTAGWTCVTTYKGHTHFALAVAFHPDACSSVFASASQDTTLRVWSLDAPGQCQSVLTGHAAGVNCVSFARADAGDRPFSLLVSGDDDGELRVWDYVHAKAPIVVVAALHRAPVMCTGLHPVMPLLFTGSLDETLQMMSTSTWRTVTVRRPRDGGMGRVWCVAAEQGGGRNKIAVGCDNGFVVLSVGSEGPIAAMLPPANTAALFAEPGRASSLLELDLDDGCRALPAAESGDLGCPQPLLVAANSPVDPSRTERSSEGLPRRLLPSDAGADVAVLTFDDDELAVRAVDTWELKLAAGGVVDFAWRPKAAAGSFALLRDTGTTLETYTGYVLHATRQLPTPVDALFGGPTLLAGRDAKTGECFFYEWETLRHAETAKLSAQGTRLKEAVWSEDGVHVALVTDPAGVSLYQIAVTSGATDGAVLRPRGALPETKCRGRVLAVTGGFVFVDADTGRVALWHPSATGVGRHHPARVVIGAAPRGFFLLGYRAETGAVFLVDGSRMVLKLYLRHGIADARRDQPQTGPSRPGNRRPVEAAPVVVGTTPPPHQAPVRWDSARSLVVRKSTDDLTGQAVEWLRREEPDISRAMEAAAYSGAAIVAHIVSALTGRPQASSDDVDGLFGRVAQASRVVHGEWMTSGDAGAAVRTGLVRYHALVSSSRGNLEALEDAITAAYPDTPVSCRGV